MHNVQYPSRSGSDDFKQLKIIRGVSLSPREIDVLACLLSGKAMKSIGTLLSTSPRTVETHMRSIMLKFGCGSREKVIEFAEKSLQFSSLKNHYTLLLRESAFKKTLEKIAGFTKKNPAASFVIYGAQQQSPFLQELAGFCKTAGLAITVTYKTPASSLSVVELTPEVAVICRQEGSLNTPLLFVSNESVFASDLLPKINNIDFVDFSLAQDSTLSNAEHFYGATFEVLKKILPETPVDSISADFLDHHNRSPSTVLKRDFSESIPDAKERSPISLKLSFLPRLRIGVLVLYILLIAIVYGLSQYHSKQDNLVRSDFVLPHKSALLERTNLLSKIESCFNTQESGIRNVALVGIGGAGKTTLSRIYARTHKFQVMWEINSETKDHLLNSFNELASLLAKSKEQREELHQIQSIINIKLKEKQLLAFVKSRLKEISDWLLIYDNVDSFADMKSYFPDDPEVWGNGRVMITTRDSNIANTNQIRAENIVRLEELSATEALTFFCKILYDQPVEKLPVLQRERVSLLLKNIPCFPLDIAAAAYHIKDTDISVEQYLKTISTPANQDFEEFQQRLFKYSIDYGFSRYKLLTLSFEKILEENTEFQELLLLLILFDSQDIPKDLLYAYKPAHVVDTFIRVLKKHSLITTRQHKFENTSISTISLHRETQNTGRNFLLKEIDNNAAKTINKIVTQALTYSENCINRNFHQGILFLPHLQELSKSLLKAVKHLPSLKPNIPKIYYAIGNTHFRCTRNLILAKDYFIQAFNSHIDGGKDLDSFRIKLLLNRLTTICNDLEQPDEAIFYAKEFLKQKEGHDPLKIANLYALARAYNYKNDFHVSKMYYEKALKILHTFKETNGSSFEAELKTSLGFSLLDFESEIYASLGWLYSTTFIALEKAQPAFGYLKKALKLINAEKSVIGQPKNKVISSSIARIRLDIGDTYCRAGLYDQAESEGFKEAEYIIDHRLDDCPHKLLKVYIQVGMSEIYLRRGQLNQAKFTIEKTLRAAEKIAGENNAIDFSLLIFLIETNIRLGELEEAYRNCQKVFTMNIMSKTNYTSILYLTTFYFAAVIKLKQNDYSKASKHFEEFFKLMDTFCRNFFDPQDYNSLKAKGVFEFYPSVSLEKSRKYLEHAEELYAKIHGKQHPFVKGFVILTKND